MDKNYNDERLYFNILKSLAIMLVVSGHLGGVFDNVGIPIWSNKQLFTAYSFHMPVFIFVSGYFYKVTYEENIRMYIDKKIKNLVIPYYKVNLFYGILTSILIYFNLFKKAQPLNLYNLIIEPWISGYQFNLNGPGWFVLFLFLVQIFYLIIRVIIKNIKVDEFRKDAMMLFIFILIGFFVAYESIGFNEKENPLIWIIYRVLYGIQFYHGAYMIKLYFKDKIPLTLVSFIILCLIKATWIIYVGNTTLSLRTLQFYDKVFEPFVVSVLGIYYILHISKFIQSIIVKNNNYKISKIFTDIGQNTWSIMMHHMTVSLMYYNTIGKINSEILNYFLLPVLALVLPIVWAKVYDKYSVGLKGSVLNIRNKYK